MAAEQLQKELAAFQELPYWNWFRGPGKIPRKMVSSFELIILGHSLFRVPWAIRKSRGVSKGKL
jgi:hypothetical protein